MTTMTANVLTTNYRQYIKLQLDLQRAVYRNKLEPCPERVKALVEAVQEPASKLSEFEKEYAEWVLDIYHPETGIDIKELKNSLGSTKSYALRAAMRGRMHFSPNSRWNSLYWEYGLPLTKTGTDAYGNAEFEPLTLAQQREWVEDLAEDYRREA